MLHGDCGYLDGNTVLLTQLEAVGRVRPEYLRRHLGKQLVVGVITRLVLGEERGVFSLSDVVVVGARLGKVRVFADTQRAYFGKARHRKRVVERAQRVVYQHFDERRVVIYKLVELGVGDYVEYALENRLEQHTHEHRSECGDAEEACNRDEIERGNYQRRQEQQEHSYRSHAQSFEHESHALYGVGHRVSHNRARANARHHHYEYAEHVYFRAHYRLEH